MINCINLNAEVGRDKIGIPITRRFNVDSHMLQNELSKRALKSLTNTKTVYIPGNVGTKSRCSSETLVAGAASEQLCIASLDDPVPVNTTSS